MGPDREPKEETQVKLNNIVVVLSQNISLDNKSWTLKHCSYLIVVSKQAEAVSSESEGEIEVALPAGEEGGQVFIMTKIWIISTTKI